MTYAEEKALAHKKLMQGFGVKKKFLYAPGLMDRCTPNVISGVPIEVGATVWITNPKVDPCGKIVWITDGKGNEQSVWKAALANLR